MIKLIKDPNSAMRLFQFREELTDLLTTGSLTKNSEKDLKKKYKLSDNQFRNYLKHVIENINLYSIEKTKNKFAITLNDLHKRVELLVKNTTNTVEFRKNTYLMTHLIEKTTDFLERFHIKAKAQENINVTVEKQLVIDSFDEVEK